MSFDGALAAGKVADAIGAELCRFGRVRHCTDCWC
jgi:hypothetical protein